MISKQWFCGCLPALQDSTLALENSLLLGHFLWGVKYRITFHPESSQPTREDFNQCLLHLIRFRSFHEYRLEVAVGMTQFKKKKQNRKNSSSQQYLEYSVLRFFLTI